MSSLSLLLDIVDELNREGLNPSMYGNDFGFGVHPNMLHNNHNYLRASNPSPHHHQTLPLAIISRLGSGDRHENHRKGHDQNEIVSHIGKDGFQACMDVTQFKPNELNVKIVDNHVVVEGKHEERQDNHGYISRQFLRRFNLPKDYDASNVTSTLSSDGILTVSIPKPQIEQKSNERVIQIQQTGPAHLNVKQNSAEKAAADKDAVAGSNNDANAKAAQ